MSCTIDVRVVARRDAENYRKDSKPTFFFMLYIPTIAMLNRMPVVDDTYELKYSGFREGHLTREASDRFALVESV